MGNGKGPGQRERAKLDQEAKQLHGEYEQLNQEAEKLWPRYTEAHQKAHTAIKNAEKESWEATEAADKAVSAAKQARTHADKLEADFKAKVDSMERSGKPDPDPDKSRALAREMDAAAEAANKAEAAASDANHAREVARIHFRRAYDANEEAKAQDPVYQKEIQPKLDDFYRRQDDHNRRNEEWRDKYETDTTSDLDDAGGMDDMRVAAASTAGMGAGLLADSTDEGFVGDEGGDLEPAASGQSEDLVSATAGGGQLDDSAPTSTDWATTEGDSQVADSGMDTSGGVDPAGGSAGGDPWAEQTFEPEVVAAADPAPAEAEEFVDEGTPS